MSKFVILLVLIAGGISFWVNYMERKHKRNELRRRIKEDIPSRRPNMYEGEPSYRSRPQPNRDRGEDDNTLLAAAAIVAMSDNSGNDRHRGGSDDSHSGGSGSYGSSGSSSSDFGGGGGDFGD